MFHTREYSIEYFSSNIFSNRFILVTSNINSLRSQKLIQELSNIRLIDINYSVSLNSKQLMEDSFTIRTNYESQLSNASYHSLYNDLQQFVALLNHDSKSIIIDISSFHLRFLGAFLSVLNDYSWDSIICSYTEPTAYPRIKSSDNEFAVSDVFGFDLNNSFLGYEEIPNLKTTSNKQDNYIWIVFLGFEGKRATGIYMELSDSTSVIIPTISLPSIRPGWVNYAFEANQNLFENANLYCSSIQYVDALNPFAVYNFIEKMQKQYPDSHLVLSPLGTRPVSLGVLLYAMHHEESEVYYDTPKSSCSKIINSGEIHFYDVLSFFEKNDEVIL